MAKKVTKTVAQKVASASKKKTPARKQEKKDEEKAVAENQERSFLGKWDIPARFISSVIFLAAFILLLVIFLVPEGVVVRLLENFIHGLIGRVGFLTAVPCISLLFTHFPANVPFGCGPSVLACSC